METRPEGHRPRQTPPYTCPTHYPLSRLQRRQSLFLFSCGVNLAASENSLLSTCQWSPLLFQISREKKVLIPYTERSKIHIWQPFRCFLSGRSKNRNDNLCLCWHSECTVYWTVYVTYCDRLYKLTESLLLPYMEFCMHSFRRIGWPYDTRTQIWSVSSYAFILLIWSKIRNEFISVNEQRLLHNYR